ncbi:hypothetical protein [Altericista sp. CCNU0014]|uniref:hypothetical protein n=1 Tax=Altericista sp. CCNU0014 TaxID=3082949 RepID=UPI00384A6F39
MNIDRFKDLYRVLLIQMGVSSDKAESACQHLTVEDMKIISEIWPEWQSIFSMNKT